MSKLLYIRFTDKPVCSTTEIVNDEIMVDWDKNGNMIGMEIISDWLELRITDSGEPRHEIECDD